MRRTSLQCLNTACQEKNIEYRFPEKYLYKEEEVVCGGGFFGFWCNDWEEDRKKPNINCTELPSSAGACWAPCQTFFQASTPIVLSRPGLYFSVRSSPNQETRPGCPFVALLCQELFPRFAAGLGAGGGAIGFRSGLPGRFSAPPLTTPRIFPSFNGFFLSMIFS